jgi:hypothetical protein
LTKDIKVIWDYIIKYKVFVCLKLYYKFLKGSFNPLLLKSSSPLLTYPMFKQLKLP